MNNLQKSGSKGRSTDEVAEVLLEERESPAVSSMSELINHSNRRFNQALSSIHLESRDTDELRVIVENVVEGVKEDYDV